MRTKFTVHHNEHVSSRSFEEVADAFESAVGSVEDIGLEALSASAKSAEEFESQVKITGEHEWFHALLHRRSWRLDGARRIERQGQNVHNRQSVDRSDHARTRHCRGTECSGAVDDL